MGLFLAASTTLMAQDQYLRPVASSVVASDAWGSGPVGEVGATPAEFPGTGGYSESGFSAPVPFSVHATGTPSWDATPPPPADPWARSEGFLEPAWRPESLAPDTLQDEVSLEQQAFEPSWTWDEWRARGDWLYSDSVVAPRIARPALWWDAVGRTNYVNDQRWEFTGAEATFGVEGILRGGGTREVNGIQIDFGTELLLQQPFDRNVLIDSPERVAYRPNFDVPPLEISQLAIRGSVGDLSLTLGKFVTPFGRTDYPILTNARWDGPFIRTQAISYRETGALISWTPGPWRIDAAVTNGNEDRDTNSSKALVSRVGWESAGWTCGASIKYQDGIGSEGQKYFQNHVGLDAAYRWGSWIVSGELIYDEYGFRRPGFAPDGIFWGRDLYHRDLHLDWRTPITGWGFYGGIGRVWGERWTTWASYGEFHPTLIGDRIHDHHNRRIEFKGVRHLGRGLDLFGSMMLENSIETAFAGKTRHGNAILFGAQLAF